MKERPLKDRYSDQEAEYLDQRERELLNYREIIQSQEAELNAYRNKLKKESLAREKELHQELEARERYFSEREKKLLERQKTFEEQANIRQMEISELKHRLQNEIAEKEENLNKAILELHMERERLSEESRQKLQQNSNTYVEDALKLLSSKEERFHFLSKLWAAIGATSLGLGVVFFIVVTLLTTESVTEITWQLFLFVVFKGVVSVALLVAIAKYSYLFSSSYMHESLKNADRRHAINFGKFYLESYGASAEWSEVKETKQDRHISFLGLREIHQKHLIADLVFLINELKTTLRIFLYFSVGYGLEL
ncbi:MAG: hypothetical protein U9Q87_00030 [Pseudomonadota bacterium]|nr:hypothetical protein [Pseudomonadota bacterium]